MRLFALGVLGIVITASAVWFAFSLMRPFDPPQFSVAAVTPPPRVHVRTVKVHRTVVRVLPGERRVIAVRPDGTAAAQREADPSGITPLAGIPGDDARPDGDRDD